jgi:hypothetical protein
VAVTSSNRRKLSSSTTLSTHAAEAYTLLWDTHTVLTTSLSSSQAHTARAGCKDVKGSVCIGRGKTTVIYLAPKTAFCTQLRVIVELSKT